MAQDWIVTIWGVRGAMPVVSSEYMEFGGNTSCVSVDCGEDLVIFDAGTGLSTLSRRLNLKRPIHIFISHTHIDHLLGLYIFAALHDPAAEIHFYGEPRAGRSFRQQLETVIAAPYWPVGFQDFRACITVHEVGPDQTVPLPGGRTVRAMRSNHPNLSLIYRLQDDRRSIIYTLDCELTGAMRPQLASFCRDADLLIWDANYTAEDLHAHTGWGHSSWQQGADLARDAGVRRAVMTHFDQSYTDVFLREQEQLARRQGVEFAREGMEVIL